VMIIFLSKNKLVCHLFFLILLFLHCYDPQLDDETVAIVGKEKILKDDLIISYELLPTWAPSKKGKEALTAHLDLLIQKKLFAQEGRKLGYAKHPDVIKAVNWYRNEELRKALYRTIVEDQIEISEQELLETYYKNNMQLHIRHLFSKTEEGIKRIQQALKDGVLWEEIAKVSFKDSILANNGGDLGWLGFGDMEETFEDSAFAQRIVTVSQPVKTSFGYHLIQVINVRKNVMMSQDDFISKKSLLENMVFRRESKKLSSAFIKEFMAEKKVEMINKTFNFLVSKIRDRVIGVQSDENISLRMMEDNELNNLTVGLEGFQNEALITYKDGVWTIGDFMEKLQNLPVHRRPRMESPAKFRHDLGVMIRDDFLTQEAKKRGLEEDPTVQKEVRYWEDEHIFSQLWQDIQDTMTISDESARAFFEKHRSRYWIPERVRIQEILVRTQSEAEKIVKRLESGEDFSVLAEKYSLRRTTFQTDGDLGWLTRGQLGNISLTAFELKIGQISKPIMVEGGYSVIKLLDRTSQRNKTFKEAELAVKADLRQQLSGIIYDQWVARLKTKTKIQINDSLLIRLGNELATEGRVLLPGVRDRF